MLVAGTATNLQGVRFHAASSLAALLVSHGQQHQARGLLRGKLEATVHHPYWHIRLLLQLAVRPTSRTGNAGCYLLSFHPCSRTFWLMREMYQVSLPHCHDVLTTLRILELAMHICWLP